MPTRRESLSSDSGVRRIRGPGRPPPPGDRDADQAGRSILGLGGSSQGMGRSVSSPVLQPAACSALTRLSRPGRFVGSRLPACLSTIFQAPEKMKKKTAPGVISCMQWFNRMVRLNPHIIFIGYRAHTTTYMQLDLSN